MNESLVGTKLGQYELHAALGQGGMATVYRAVQPTLNRSVAVKVLPLSRLPDPSMPARFRREAQLAASLLHPNIVPVYDFGEWEGYLYIVMALVAGGTLKDRADAQLPVEAVVRLVGQVADALAFAHAQGIYHRDIKPTNVLLERADWAMLGDFGIARAIGDMTRLTSPYGTIGTPAYMAPEQWLGGDIDGRADLYSLGIVLYQLLTGSVPFTAPTSEGLMRQHLDMPAPSLSSRRPGLPPGLEDVVQTALAKEPDARYRHAGEFKAALEAAVRLAHAPGPPTQTHLASADGPITTNPHLGQTYRVPAPDERAPEPRSGKVVQVLIALVLLLVGLLAGMIGYIAAGGRPNTVTPAATPTTLAAATQAPPAQVTQPSAPTPPAQGAAPSEPPIPTQPPAPTPTTLPAARDVANEEPTPAPPTAAPPPPPAPTATPRPALIQPTAPAKVPPTATAQPDRGHRILAPANGATVPADFTVQGVRQRPLPRGAHLWLFIRADIPNARWYPCFQGERVPRPDGVWECNVSLGVPPGMRVELRVGTVDEPTHADLTRSLAPEGQPNQVSYPDQRPGYLPPSFIEEARVIVTRR